MRKEQQVGFFWLTLTLIGEVFGYVLRYLFGIWAAHYLLLVYGRFPVSHLHPVTPAQVGWSFVVIGLLMHMYILARQLPKPQQERVNMRPRQPSKREKELVERAYKLMEQKATINRALPFRHPLRFRVYQGEGYRVRFIGKSLLIDVALFPPIGGSPYLNALLAHALWYYNSSDLLVRRLLELFPPESDIVLGFTGRALTWIGWQFYKRSQVYHADEYTARLGQKHALIQTLEELFLPLDTPRERYIYDEPYVELYCFIKEKI
jgi:hypothetical protein